VRTEAAPHHMERQASQHIIARVPARWLQARAAPDQLVTREHTAWRRSSALLARAAHQAYAATPGRPEHGSSRRQHPWRRRAPPRACMTRPCLALRAASGYRPARPDVEMPVMK
jgi:hypothetical protein